MPTDLNFEIPLNQWGSFQCSCSDISRLVFFRVSVWDTLYTYDIRLNCDLWPIPYSPTTRRIVRCKINCNWSQLHSHTQSSLPWNHQVSNPREIIKKDKTERRKGTKPIPMHCPDASRAQCTSFVPQFSPSETAGLREKKAMKTSRSKDEK